MANNRLNNLTDDNIACATEDGDDQQKTPGIPLSRKLCYAIGGMPYQMTATAKGFFMQIFLLDVVKMEAFSASIILFLGRAWDGITDPLIGYTVSNSGRTRIGKLIPWIVFTMPLGVLSYVMLWYTPQHTMSSAFSFSWYFIWCCLFDTFMSCYHVPYSSLNMFLGGNEKDRDSATGYRMGMEMFATLAGAAIQGQIVGAHHAKKTRDCSLQNETVGFSGNHTDEISVALQNTRTAYLTGALILGMLYFLCCLVLFLGVKEQLDGSGKFRPLLYSCSAYGRIFPASCSLVIDSSHNIHPSVADVIDQNRQESHYIHRPFNGYPSSNCDISSEKSMLPDVVDDFKVKNPSCQDLEPLFYSCYVFFNKFGGGMSVGISTLVLHFVGYKPGACRHNPAVIHSLRVLFAPVPICLLLISLVLFYFYPINEERRQEIQKALRKAGTETSMKGEEELSL
ncbi:sodium-dependent lysophosphatidylcholine symporter 1-like isoform X2 [Chanodichthys erythropterus]|uniref:sodium-dependent lysophosphatidylcholine symporter 1-like isoform X2 n=1 Tax=Chanodichthys erythropterus TaxID=933992 RepID=UPI00351F00FE